VARSGTCWELQAILPFVPGDSRGGNGLLRRRWGCDMRTLLLCAVAAVSLRADSYFRPWRVWAAKNQYEQRLPAEASDLNKLSIKAEPGPRWTHFPGKDATKANIRSKLRAPRTARRRKPRSSCCCSAHGTSMSGLQVQHSGVRPDITATELAEVADKIPERQVVLQRNQLQRRIIEHAKKPSACVITATQGG